MKVLVVSNMYPSKKYPSAGIFVEKFCRQANEAGVDIELCVMTKGSTKLQKAYNYFSFYFSSFAKCLFYKYDVVYVHYVSHSSLGVLLARKIKKFTIYSNVHGSDVIPENDRQEKFQKYAAKILSLSEKVICPSEYFKDVVSEKYKINNTVVVYPSAGVDNTFFYPFDSTKRNEVKEKMHLDATTPIVGFVSRITQDKGWDTYCEAVKLLEKTNIQFVLVGQGNQESELNDLLNNLNIADRIIRYPLMSQDDLLNLYNILDVFVFPTERKGESLGLVAIEAMACGTPVIASDFAAPSKYVIDNYNGMKFMVEDHEMLARKINEYFGLPFAERERMKSNALNTAREYDTNKCLTIIKEQIFDI